MNIPLWQRRFRDHLVLRGCSARTVASYGAELEPFLGFVELRGLDLAGVTRETVEEYRTHLFTLRPKGRPLALKTQQVRLCAVKAFLRFLARERYLLVDPARAVRLPRIPRTLPRTLLTEEEVERLLEAPDVATCLGLRDRALLEVLYSTAVRNSEVRELRVDDADLERRELRVRHAKGGRSRVVPLGEEARVWLDRYLVEARPRLVGDPGQERVFVTWRGRGFDRCALSRAVVRAGRRAGLSKKVTPHLLRHACATHMLARGAGLRHLQELLGHASPVTTQRYTALELSQLRRVHRRTHPREQDR